MNDAAIPVAVYVSLGSNINPQDNLKLACDNLSQTYGDLQLSQVYRSHPVGFKGDDFLNMVVGFKTREQPQSLLDHFEVLHQAAQRERQANPYSPRTLDLDLLLYGSLVSRQLKIPHHDIDKYPFVIGPLAELAPLLEHPVSGQTMAELWEKFDRSQCPMQHVDLDLGLNPGQKAEH